MKPLLAVRHNRFDKMESSMRSWIRRFREKIHGNGDYQRNVLKYVVYLNQNILMIATLKQKESDSIIGTQNVLNQVKRRPQQKKIY
jgi:hypothetical protein